MEYACQIVLKLTLIDMLCVFTIIKVTGLSCNIVKQNYNIYMRCFIMQNKITISRVGLKKVIWMFN